MEMHRQRRRRPQLTSEATPALFGSIDAELGILDGRTIHHGRYSSINLLQRMAIWDEISLPNICIEYLNKTTARPASSGPPSRRTIRKTRIASPRSCSLPPDESSRRPADVGFFGTSGHRPSRTAHVRSSAKRA